jgi:hypothetical protein
MTYLRIVEFQELGRNDRIDIFDETDIETDRAYWLKYHNGKARYFKIQEV